MVLKLVRTKKVTPAAASRRKKSEIEKFKDAIDVQMRLASGEKVKQGRGFAKSWVERGLAAEGKLSSRIYLTSRKQKKAVAVKKG